MSCLSCQTKRAAAGMRIQMPSDRLKKPAFLKIKYAPPNARYSSIRKSSAGLNLATVCAEAMCPNINECWGSGTATFMIMGDTCTRACKFCNVNHGRPDKLDAQEPKKLIDTIKKMKLDYAVITSVDRDDLPDLGANHFAKCIKTLRARLPELLIEILTPDFSGRKDLIKLVAESGAHVFGHNLETVKRLQKTVRDRRANYQQSLDVLEYAKKVTPKIFTKSSLMVGLGETPAEVVSAMRDLRDRDVDFLTIGQYLRPTAWNLPVVKYVTLAQFKKYEKTGLKMGFKYVASGPFVRSSYKAGELYDSVIARRP